MDRFTLYYKHIKKRKKNWLLDDWTFGLKLLLQVDNVLYYWKKQCDINSKLMPEIKMVEK